MRVNRLKVWRKGKLLAETTELAVNLRVAGQSGAVAFQTPRMDG